MPRPFWKRFINNIVNNIALKKTKYLFLLNVKGYFLDYFRSDCRGRMGLLGWPTVAEILRDQKADMLFKGEGSEPENIYTTILRRHAV